MTPIALLLLFVASPVWGAPQGWERQPDPGRDFEFSYESSDGEIALECKHWLENDLPMDWKVLCGPGTPLEREFLVHLIIRGYRRAAKPQQAYEILYWVINRSTEFKSRYTSSTSWIELDTESRLHQMSLSQGVENDYAQLKLRFLPEKR